MSETRVLEPPRLFGQTELVALGLTSLQIACCAADVMVSRVRISGQESPPPDQWVEVTGTWLEGTGPGHRVPAALVAERS